MFVASCPRQPIFKERLLNVTVNMSCKCLDQSRGRCNNYKIKCFNLNFIADKIKVSSLDVPSGIQLKTIDDNLKKTLKACYFLFF